MFYVMLNECMIRLGRHSTIDHSWERVSLGSKSRKDGECHPLGKAILVA